MYFKINIVLFVTLFCYINAEEELLPSFIEKCDYKDKKVDSCIRKQIENSLSRFAKGIPELGVPSIDPVQLDEINIDGNGLKLKFVEAAMYGLSDSKLTDLKVDIGSNEEDFNLGFKGNMSLIAKYNIDGKILILPIKGDGDAVVKANNVEVNIQSKLVHVKDSKGRSHLKLITPNYKYDIQSTTFDLKNLFNGNKELAETTLSFANENWRQLMDDLAPPAIKQIVRSVIKAINKFFSKVPISEMVTGYKDS
ncbi:PREDICTED: circadian clock-controlled protein-like [Papilio xuthus]|uniref:Circadian clock-controlled protein-like n=1 Tax=Papilio xuthus TaxID=66420 RepID=A0AAJ7EFJ0_PAPXU|nr:PREDICTED: circadian clock-controlled protein-like [Papilio xuthus]